MANKDQKDSRKTGRDKSQEYRPRKQGTQKQVDGAPFPDQDALPSRQQRRGAEMDNTGSKMSKTNNPESYKKYDQFATDSATLPFARPVGVPINIIDNTNHGVASANQIVPGVMALYFIPSIGVAENFNAPINRSSIRFYTYLRSNQKASASYDHQDITMMEVAMDSAYMFHGLCAKLYAIINQFTPVNEYLSRTTVRACGGDFDDLRANLQDFRAYINAYAYSLGQYALPKDIELFNRHRWMVEGQYTDSDTTKAQIYMFVPAGFWKYDNTVSTGSQCTWVTYQSTTTSATVNTYTFAQLKAIGDQLLKAVSNEEDFAVISGDIYNFYGGDTFKLPYVDENYSILPTFDKAVLSQIENATIYPIKQASLVISQNPSVNEGAILFTPELITADEYAITTEMNFHWDRPTPDDVLDASRLISVVSGDGQDIIACGTEIVCGMRVFTRKPADLSPLEFSYHAGLSMFNTTASAAAMTGAWTGLLVLAQFDWAPQVRVWTYDGTTATFAGTTWDIDNYDYIPKEYMSNIHTACLLSLFKVGTNRE